MSQCRECGQQCAHEARFCHVCGEAMKSQQDEGNTVIARTLELPEFDLVNSHADPYAYVPGRKRIGPWCVEEQRELTVMLIDVSGSIGEEFEPGVTKMTAEQRGTCSMIIIKARIDPTDEIGLVTFNQAAQVLLPMSPLSTHRQQMITLIQSLTPNGGTDINAGLKAARDLFDWHRQGVVRRIVLLTDGHGGEPLTTAEDLKGRGAVIDVIGVGPDPSRVNEKLLRKVASFIDGELHYRFIKDQKTLVDHYSLLAQKTKVGV